jgi:hypothetical protein
MSLGRILTQGFGSFGGRRYLPTMGLGSFAGPEVAATDGWRSGQFNRVSVAPATNRTSVAGELSRVVWAAPQGK